MTASMNDMERNINLDLALPALMELRTLAAEPERAAIELPAFAGLAGLEEALKLVWLGLEGGDDDEDDEVNDDDAPLDEDDLGDLGLIDAIDRLHQLADGTLGKTEVAEVAGQLTSGNARLLRRLIDLADDGLDHVERDELLDETVEAAMDRHRDGRDAPRPPASFADGMRQAIDDQRRRDEDEAAAAARLMVEQAVRQRRAPVLLIADGGAHAARASLAQRIQGDLESTDHVGVFLDAGLDPFLPEAAAPDSGPARPLTVLDGDVAPSLGDIIGADGRLAYIVVAPDSALERLGRALEPDLVVDVGPNAPTQLATPDGPEQALAALRQLSGAEPIRPGEPRWRLPRGRALEDAIQTAINALWDDPEPARRAAEALRLLRRLSLGPRADETRRVLRGRPSLDDQFQARRPEHWLAWSALYRDAGLVQEAKDVLVRARAATDDAHDDVRVRHALATLDMRLNQPTAAAAEFAQLPFSPHAAHGRARALRLDHDLDQAHRVVTEALAAWPVNLHLLIEAGVIASLRRDWRTADAHFHAAQQASPRAGFILNAWARALIQAGEMERAAGLLRRASELEPWNPRHPLERASLATQRGLVREAETLLAPLQDALDPTVRGRARVQLADTLLAMGQLDAAKAGIAELEQAFEEEDPGAEARLRLTSLQAQADLADGRFGTALVRLSRGAQRLNPYLRAQHAQVALADGNLALAENDLRALDDLPATRANPASQRVAATLRAQLLSKRGRHHDARQTLHDAIERELGKPQAGLLTMLGKIETEAGDREAAERAFRDAIDADPRNAKTRRAYAAFLIASNRADDARVHQAAAAAAGLAPTAVSPDSIDPTDLD